MSVPKYKLKDILAALKASGGQVNLAAQKLGCERSTIYKRALQYPIITETIAAIRDEMVDFAEVALRRAVLNGDLDAVKFTLKTLGKSRGYVERHEYSNPALDALIAAEFARIAGVRSVAAPGEVEADEESCGSGDGRGV